MPTATLELGMNATAPQIAPRLSLAHVSHRYGRVLAVEDVSLNVAAGRTCLSAGAVGLR